MKTIHRIMNEVLTVEEYKNFCRNINPERITDMMIEGGYRRPGLIIGSAFDWDHSRQGLSYWGDIQKRLANNPVHKVN